MLHPINSKIIQKIFQLCTFQILFLFITVHQFPGIDLKNCPFQGVFKVGSRGVVVVLTWVETVGFDPGHFSRNRLKPPRSGGHR